MIESNRPEGRPALIPLVKKLDKKDRSDKEDATSDEEPDYMKIDAFLEVILRLEMDTTNTVNTFEEVGMTNPLKP